MVAPSLRVPMVVANTGATGGAATSTVALTVDASAVVGADYLLLRAAFLTGVDTTVPAAHTPATLARAGWDLIPGSTQQTSNDTLTTAEFIKQCATGDPGSSVTVTSTTGARNSALLAVVKGAGSYGSAVLTLSEAGTTFGTPAFTPPAGDVFAVAASGVRWPAAAVTGIAALSGWTEVIDDVTTNAAGQLVGTWAATRTITGGSGAAVAASSITMSTITHGTAVVWFLASTATLAANAGPDRTVAAFSQVNLTGTSSGGSVTSSSWSQVSGPAVTLSTFAQTVSFTAPGSASAQTVTLRYTVTGATTVTDDVVVTVAAARNLIVSGGVLVPIRPYVPTGGGVVVPPTTAITLFSPFYGGGGQSAFAWDPISTHKGATGSDTGGPRFFGNDTKDSTINLLGLTGLGAKQADGIAFSAAVPGVAFMQCGRVPIPPGTPDGAGGVYYSVAGGAWVRLDGVLSGKPVLNFNGGNVNLTYAPGSPVLPAGTQYPRHYADGTMLVDDTSIPGTTFLFVSTVRDGAWRFKLRNTDWVVLEQTLIPGTANLFARSMAFLGSKSRLLVGVYDGTTPKRPLLVTNANVATGTSITSATMSSTPTNVEQAECIAAPVTGVVPLTVIVTGSATTANPSGFQGDVLVSTDAHTAAAGAITWTSVASTASTSPESDEWWIGVGLTTEDRPGGGQNHVILCSAVDSGRKVGSIFHSVWRGTVSATSTTPATGITWATPTFSEQVLGVPGASNKWWNAGVNTPVLSGTATVSAFSVHPLDPSLVAITAKGNTFLSRDGGKTWDPSAIAGSSEHNAAWWDWWGDATRRNRFMTTTGDWPLAAAVDLPPAKTFDSQGNAVLRVSTAAAQGGSVDPRTGEVFIHVKTAGGGHSIGTSDPNLALISYDGAAMSNTFVDLNGSTDWALPKDIGGTSASAIMGMCVGYGTSTTSACAIIIARHLGNGMWYRNRTTSTWTQILAVSGTAPFMSSSTTVDQSSVVWDDTHKCAYFLSRATGVVWRVTLNAAGIPQPAVRLFQRTWSYSVAGDGVGNVDIDEANDRLWVSTKDGVLYLNTASTAANVAGTTDTNGAFVAVPWQTYYPGEIPGPMQYLPALDAVWVHTELYATATSAIYPVAGTAPSSPADGPRSLVISNPTVGSSWSPSAADDRSVSRDRGLRTGLVYAKGSSRNWDGSLVTIQQQGSGLFVMRTT